MVTAGQPLLAFLSTNFFIPKLCFMKYIIGLVAMLLPLLSGAQSPPVKTLHVGDTVPDITLTNVYNYPSSTIRLSDLKGKLVILDFWATWCGSCIKVLPSLNKIQSEFKGQIQILVVGYQAGKTVQSFLQNNALAKGIKLPFITSDSTLKKLFPHHTIPHEVWIDKNGFVKAITGDEYLTPGNVQAMIAGTISTLPEKKDVLNYTSRKPLLENDNGGNDKLLLYRSTLTKYIEGLFSGHINSIDPDSTVRRLTFINLPLLSLYYSAGMKTLPYANRVILEVSNLPDYIDTTTTHISWNEWAKKHVYCYEVSIPIGTSQKAIDQMMLEDLNKSFGINGRIENRRIKCFALVMTSKNDNLFKSKGGIPVNQLYGDAKTKKLLNQPLSKLIEALNNQIAAEPLKPVVVDETGYTGMVDLNLPVNEINDIPRLRIILRKYGLDIIPVERVMPLFVITDKKEAAFRQAQSSASVINSKIILK